MVAHHQAPCSLTPSLLTRANGERGAHRLRDSWDRLGVVSIFKEEPWGTMKLFLSFPKIDLHSGRVLGCCQEEAGLGRGDPTL